MKDPNTYRTSNGFLVRKYDKKAIEYLEKLKDYKKVELP